MITTIQHERIIENAEYKRGPVKYFYSKEMNDAIKKVYAESVKLARPRTGAPVANLAKRFGYPAKEITRQAKRLGVSATIQYRGPSLPWSERELEIMEKHSYKTGETIGKYLKKEGFKRSVPSIITKRRKMRFDSNDYYSANDLIPCFGVSITVILSWIDNGMLEAPRKETAREKNKDYCIKKSHLRKFIKNYIASIDIRKIDKWWLVDILTEK